ncbi:hypothetical protein [Agrobacterium vitis]|uniref:hypothetical protein n=1 Tax=Agrobacterium vitis TaxID=373 RepID=UPI0012E79520|nr:hypothetical protein [Agrobacterium vitis]MVA60625.1 hypothetical protein [Agrobacterium vitis]
MEEKKRIGNVIWWCCFLESGDRIYDSISEIGILLKNSGQQLVVLGQPGDYTRYVGFEHIAVSVSLVAQGLELNDIPGTSSLPMTLTSLPELLETESFWSGAKPTFQTELCILKAARFWEKSFEIMQPSLIIAWGSSAPFSRLLLRIANLTQTPSYVAERGLTENTLMFNLLGQCIVSNIGTKLSYIKSKVKINEVKKEWAVIRDYYKNIAERQYKNSVNVNVGNIVDKISKRGPVVLFLGAFDLGSGLAFNDKSLGGRFARAHKSSQEAAQAVADALSISYPGATLINKSHPASPYEVISTSPDIYVINVHDADFRELIELSDVIVTPISTTQIYGFIYNKPVITLSNSFFSGRDITYDVTDEYSLENAINDAIEHIDWQNKFERAKTLIVNLFRDEFIGLTDDVPCRLQVADLARHFTLFKSYKPYHFEDAKARLESYYLLESFAKQRPFQWSAEQIKSFIGVEHWNLIASEIIGESNRALEAELQSRIGLKHFGGDLAANIEEAFKEFAGESNRALETELQSRIGLKHFGGDLAANIEEAFKEFVGESNRALEAELQSRIGLKHFGGDLAANIEEAFKEFAGESNRALEAELQSRIGLKHFGGDLAANIEEAFKEFVGESNRALEAELQSRIGLKHFGGDLAANIEDVFREMMEDLNKKTNDIMSESQIKIEALNAENKNGQAREEEYQKLIDKLRNEILDLSTESNNKQKIMYHEIANLRRQIDAIEVALRESKEAYSKIDEAHTNTKVAAEVISTWVISSTRKRHASRYNGLWKLQKKSDGAPEINPVQYLIANPDVAKAGLDPIDHWLRYGKSEGRSTGGQG